MTDDKLSFPVRADDRYVSFLQQMVLWGIRFLALLMVGVILWSIIDVVLTLYLRAQEPTFILLYDLDEFLPLFGSFLVVLIAIEIFLNIILYLGKSHNHLALVVATALMAIARKVIILDYTHTSDWQMVGMGILILALGVTYWLIQRVTRKASVSDRQEGS